MIESDLIGTHASRLYEKRVPDHDVADAEAVQAFHEIRIICAYHNDGIRRPVGAQRPGEVLGNQGRRGGILHTVEQDQVAALLAILRHTIQEPGVEGLQHRAVRNHKTYTTGGSPRQVPGPDVRTDPGFADRLLDALAYVRTNAWMSVQHSRDGPNGNARAFCKITDRRQ